MAQARPCLMSGPTGKEAPGLLTSRAGRLWRPWSYIYSAPHGWGGRCGCQGESAPAGTPVTSSRMRQTFLPRGAGGRGGACAGSPQGSVWMWDQELGVVGHRAWEPRAGPAPHSRLAGVLHSGPATPLALQQDLAPAGIRAMWQIQLSRWHWGHDGRRAYLAFTAPDLSAPHPLPTSSMAGTEPLGCRDRPTLGDSDTPCPGAPKCSPSSIQGRYSCSAPELSTLPGCY